LASVGLSIDQASRITGVKKSTLRYWEKEYQDYLQPRRTATNRRQYDMDDIKKIEVLSRLINEEKYKSIGVKMKLGLN
jgi:DNA-binding transcriptional MerR regulator